MSGERFFDRYSNFEEHFRAAMLKYNGVARAGEEMHDPERFVLKLALEMCKEHGLVIGERGNWNKATNPFPPNETSRFPQAAGRRASDAR